MVLRAEIVMDNAAFEGCNGDEVARILRKLADFTEGKQLMAQEEIPLMDINGNRVGEAFVAHN